MPVNDEQPQCVMKRIYVGNLAKNVTKEELVQIFGLATTPFLESSCCVEMQNKKGGNSKGFAFLNVPEHVYVELMKLNGIELYGLDLKVEEAKPKEEKDAKKTKANQKVKGKGRGTTGGRRWGPRPLNKFTLPNLEQDQIFDLVDGGTNLTNPKFHRNTDYVVARALSAGVRKMVITGLKLVGSKSAVIMSKTRPNILYAAVGVHPHFVKDDWKKDKTINELEELVKLPEVVAVGECGLDFNRNFSPEELQVSCFKKQVALAVRYQKALLIHERDSHQGIMDVLKEFEKNLPPVVIHCFTGTDDQLKTYVAKGFYVGVTGFVCKEKHGAGLREAIKNGILPLKNIIIQTNAPYMTPNIPRDEIDPVSKTLLEHCFVDNEPCTLSIIVRCIAKCLSREPKAIARQCTENAGKVFRFKNF